MNVLQCLLVIYLSVTNLISTSTGTDVETGNDEYLNLKKLRTKLLLGYNKEDRPVRHHSNTTSVNFTFAVAYSFNYDVRNETLTLEGFFRMQWIDSRLVWNPSEYGGIDFFSVDAEEVWLPEIAVYESVPAQAMANQMRTRPMLQPNGAIIWSPRGVFKTLCPFRADVYPNGIQVCNVTFGSWAEDGLSLDFQVKSDYVYLGSGINKPNNKWKVTGFNVNRVISYRNEMANPFVNIVVTMRIIRNSLIENNVSQPSMIVATILMLSMFLLPPSSGKKLTLAATSLFMLLGVLLYMATSVKSPLVIGVTISDVRSVIFITISAILFEIIAIIISKVTIQPPPALKSIVNGKIGAFLLLNSPNKPNFKEGLQEREISAPEDTWYKTAMAVDRFLFILFINIVVINKIF